MIPRKMRRLFSPKERIKILRVFSETGKSELEPTEIANSTGLPLEFVQYHLSAADDSFIELEVLEEIIKGGIKFYRMRIEDEKVRVIRDLFIEWERLTRSRV